MNLAQGAYRRTACPVVTGAATPHEIVSATLRQLVRSLEVLEAAQRQGRPYQSEVLNRALTTIFILQSSLDFDKGENIAQELFQLYEFCRYQVCKAWKGEADTRLAEAVFAMSEIFDAWEGIGTQARQFA
ncbi:MAG: flagellar protein FliS [Rhodobacteraceae bacterium]|nr:flagellar protein FliS [Paracoccaceae bacterium]